MTLNGTGHAKASYDRLQGLDADGQRIILAPLTDAALSRLEDIWLERGEPYGDVATTIRFMANRRLELGLLDSAKIRAHLGAAMEIPDFAYTEVDLYDPLTASMPRFPTGCKRLDAMTGGGYGMTVIAGQPKVGKSLLALSAAVEAARAGWRTLYLNAELTANELRARLRRYAGSIDQRLGDNLHLIDTDSGFSPRDVIEYASGVLEIDDMRLLFVMDSINRLTDQCGEGMGDSAYWNALRQWQELARRSTKSSNGKIASIVVSELNAQNRVKGRNLEYAADLVVSMEAMEGTDSGVSISVPLARSSRGGDLGDFVRTWERGTFS